MQILLQAGTKNFARLRCWLPLSLLVVSLGCRLFVPGSTNTSSTSTAQTTPTHLSRLITQPNCLPSGALKPDQDGMGDPYFPTLGNGGYDVKHYALEMEVDPLANELTARAEIQASALELLEIFNLDFSGLQIDELRVNGEKAGFHRKGSELSIIPEKPLRKDAAFTVEVTYHGVPKPLDLGVGFELGWSQYEGGTYVAGEPAGAASWYPVNDHPCDKATYRYRVTVPEPYSVAANGLLVEMLDNGSTRTYVWEMNDPMASYLATVNVAEFVEEQSSGPNGLPIRHFFAKDLAADARVDFAQTGEMITYFSELFGPYPFDAYGVVVVGEELGFALETQSLSLFGRDAVDGQGGAGEVAAHELAHQWFGDSVSLVTWQDIWLNEGFATYAQWLWSEHNGNPGYIDQQTRLWYQRLAQAAPNPPGDPGRNDLFGMSVYFRGALTLHALREKVGDEDFFRILQTYYEQYQGGNASTEEFIDLAGHLSGQDLAEFFQGWLYRQDMPSIPEMNLSP